MTGEFWPETVEEFFAVAGNPKDPHNAWFRQVTTYWRWRQRWCCTGRFPRNCLWTAMARDFSAGEVCADSGGDPGEDPGFLIKTSELVTRFSAAGQRYEVATKNMANRRKVMAAEQESPVQDSDMVKA